VNSDLFTLFGTYIVHVINNQLLAVSSMIF